MFGCTIKSLATALDGKSPWTAGHSERVMNYAVAIASQLNDSNELIETVKTCAMLHDIGKICVPDAILEKPGLF